MAFFQRSSCSREGQKLKQRIKHAKKQNKKKQVFFLVGVSPGLFIAVPDVPKVVRSANQ